MKIKTIILSICLFVFCVCIGYGGAAEASTANQQENDYSEEEIIDTQTPEEIFYMKFKSDTIGANDLGSGTLKDGVWSGNIYEAAKKVWNKIWGKQKIEFEVYVRDSESGIENIGMSYNGKSIPQEDLKRQEELKTFTEGDAESTDTEEVEVGYTVFEGTIVCDENAELDVEDFAVEWIADKAGNVLEKRILINETGKLLSLDDVNPVLDIKIDAQDANIFPIAEQKVFFNESPKIRFLLNEKNFAKEGSPVYPKLNIRKRANIFMEFEEDSLWSTKAWEHLSDNLWQLEIKLAEDLQEMEYQFVMEAYHDPSGNVLVGVEGLKGISEEGQFESGIFVIDTTAPVLMEYIMNLPTDCKIQDLPVYENHMENDVKMKFTIDEHPEYYQPENLIIKVYKAGNLEPVYVMDGCDAVNDRHLTLEVDGRKHRYEFSYDGETNDDGAYYVTIEYRDRAGNEMVGNEQFTCENGLFISDTFLLDHTAPIFDVIYETDAVNVIQDGILQDKKRPLQDSTAYYNCDIKVKFRIEESYVHKKEDVWEHLEFELWEVTKDGKRLVSDEEPMLSEINEEKSKYEAGFTIAADVTNHETDGNYQFVIRYHDCAGNVMTGGNLELQEILKGGMYQSPILVLDTTAPEIVTRYMSEIPKCDNERKYFSIHTIFQINVSDRNIRCGDLTKELKNIQTKDRYGNPVKTTIVEDLKSQYDENEILQALGKDSAEMSVNIALTVDANYEIPVDFIDLAGNRAVVIQRGTDHIYREGYVEKVTIDTTIPKLQLTYSYEDPANYMEEGYLFAKKAMSVTAIAADAAKPAIASGWMSFSAEIRFTVTNTSAWKSSGKRGLRARSIRRATRISESEALPSRFIKPPGNLPADANFSL